MKLTLKIELADETRNQIVDQLADFRKLYPQFQWEGDENYSILVHLFGEFLNKKSIVSKLERALFDKNSFYLYAYEAALTIKNNITLYINFVREKEIEKISDGIKQEFQMFQDKERYVPLLFFASYKIPSKQQYFVIKKRLANMKIDFSFKVNKLSLFEDEKRLRIFKLI